MDSKIETSPYAIHAGSWEYHFDNDQLIVSEELKSLFSVAKSSDNFESFIELAHPNFKDNFEQKFRFQKSGFIEVGFKLKHKSSDLDECLLNRSIPSYDNQENLIGIKGVITRIDEIIENERLYGSIFKLDSVGNLILSELGIILRCNHKFAELLGFKIDEIEGQYFLNFVQDHLKSTVEKYLLSSINSTSESPIKYGTSLNSSSGREVKVIINTDKVSGYNLLVKTIVNVYDIESEKPLFKTVFDLPHAGQAIFAKDFKLIQCNKEYERITGYSQSELKNRTLEEFLAPGSLEFIQSTGYNTVEEGEIHQSYELEVFHKNGYGIWLEVHAERIAETDLVYTAIQDITSRRARKQELVETINERNSFRDALNRSALVSITNLQGKIVYVNDEFVRTSKFTRDELLGRDHRILNSAYHPREFWLEAWKTIASGNSWRADVRNRAKDGSIYWVDTTINPMKNENGKVYQYMSVRYLITDRKLMEEQQKALLSDLGDYAFMTSHELRGPLARMLGLINVIKMGNLKADEVDNLLEMLELTSTELDQVINQMNSALSRSSFEILEKMRSEQ